MSITSEPRDVGDEPVRDRAAYVERQGASFDHHDPELTADVLFDVYAKLREHEGIGHSDNYGGFYIASHYDDVVDVSRNTKVFSSAQGVLHPRHAEATQAIPVEFDGAEHAAYRRIFTKLLSKGNVDAIEDELRDIARSLVDGYVATSRSAAASGETADFAHDVAVQFPIRAVGQLLGWEGATEPEMNDLAEDGLKFYGTERSQQAMMKLAAMMQDVIDDRRADPRDDAMTELIQSKITARELTDAELRNILRTFIFAGYETTAHAIASMMLYLCHDQQLQARMRQDPTIIPKIVEESLRLFPPAHTMFRTVTEPVSLHGADMKEGDKIILLHASANRDETKYGCPMEFQIEREHEPVNVAFGFGAHFCAGAHLARAEMRLVLEELLRYPRFELAGTAEHAPHLMMGQMMGVDHLPLRFVEDES